MLSLPTPLSKSLLTSAVALACLFAGGCGEVPPFAFALSGFSCDNGHVGISGGGVLVASDEPGVLYGTLQRELGQREYSYLIVLKMDASSRTERSFSYGGFAQCVPGKLQATSTVSFNERSLQSDHLATLADDQQRTASEVLKLMGREIDPSLGRVFLFDLGQQGSALVQLDVELASLPDPIEETPVAVREHVRGLVERHAEIASFLAE